MAEYKVARVSQEEPRTWDGPNGTVYYIKTMLEGHEKPVSIGKKSPDALKIGDTVYGTIEETDYITDKFKAESKPFTPGASKSGYNDPAKQADIKAQWALGRAYEKHGATEEALKDAQWLFSNASKVGGTTEASTQSGYEKAKSVAATLPRKQEEPVHADEDYQEALGNEVAHAIDSGEPINLDDIPF